MKIFKRHLFNDIYRHISQEETTIITGSRQVGKTTLLKNIKDNLERDGENAFYITLERVEVKKMLDKNPENIFSIIPPPGSNKTFIFIDEIQYLDNPTNFLKLLYDEYRNKLKLVVTGSSAFYIDRKFKDSLAGRKRIFHLKPFSFKEVLECRGEIEVAKYVQKGMNSQEKTPLIYQDKLFRIAEEYAIYGGYPRVVLAEDYKEKQLVLYELVNSFLKKDALESSIRKESEFMLFVEVLADRIGNKLNRQELGNICNINDETVLNYIYILQKSFHISVVRPFWRSKTTELRKMPKFYFQDNGMRNAVLNNFTPVALRKDKGEIVENMAYNLLSEHFLPKQIKYWMTKEQKEVDFIIDDKFALEIKYSDSLIKKSKYKLFTETYPNIQFKFACFEKTFNNLQLWSV
ncbi:MAG: ATP-binding protein [Bacteroidota bacterium]